MLDEMIIAVIVNCVHYIEVFVVYFNPWLLDGA